MGREMQVRYTSDIQRGRGRHAAARSLLACACVRLAFSFVFACSLLGLLPGCGGSADGTSDTTAEARASSAAGNPSDSEAATDVEEVSGASFKLPKRVNVPKVADSGNPTTIDTSGANRGWVGARGSSPARLKFQVTNGEMTYNYDLPNDGSAAVYPINMGDGTYSFRIMENVEGNSYAQIDSATQDVTLDSELSPYLRPNIYCSYNKKSACVKMARSLLEGVDNQGEAVKQICTYVAENVSYDSEKAEQLAQSTGYIPNADETLKEKKGVCFDYACLTAAMLRSAGLPTRVVTGYVSPDNLYHAWIMVYVDGTWKSALFSVTPNEWSRCDVTFASAGAGAWVGDGTQYTDRYIY